MLPPDVATLMFDIDIIYAPLPPCLFAV